MPNIRHNQPGSRQHSAGSPLPPFDVNWIKTGINEKTIEYADAAGKLLANEQLTTSQIRNIFGEMRRIQLNGFSKELTSFLLLKPKMAYTAKRNKSNGLNKLKEIFDMIYENIDKKNPAIGEVHYGHAMNILESILAYHKSHERFE